MPSEEACFGEALAPEVPPPYSSFPASGIAVGSTSKGREVEAGTIPGRGHFSPVWSLGRARDLPGQWTGSEKRAGPRRRLADRGRAELSGR